MSAEPETWSQWLVNGGVWTSVGATVVWLGNMLWQRRKHSEDIAETKRAREGREDQHVSSLAIELLKIANSEMGVLKQKVAELTENVGKIPEIERRLGYFDEALFHIQQLLDVEHSLGPAAAADNARKFLAKMVFLQEAKGLAANREQAARAERRLSDKGDGE